MERERLKKNKERKKWSVEGCPDMLGHPHILPIFGVAIRICRQSGHMGTRGQGRGGVPIRWLFFFSLQVVIGLSSRTYGKNLGGSVVDCNTPSVMLQ